MTHFGDDSYHNSMSGSTPAANYDGGGGTFLADLTAELTAIKLIVSGGSVLFDDGTLYTRYR